MKHRLALLAALSMIGGAGVFGVACSSSSSGTTDDDAGTDGSAANDSSVKDGASSDTGSSDAGSQDATNERVGNCSPVKGPCDIVLQDCPTGKECVVARSSDGGLTTACVATTNNEHIPKGGPCCPSSNNPCLPGLECIGSACVGDAAPTSRCAPHCCLGDDSVCGMSSEGYQGHCDTNVQVNGTVAYQICTYTAVCKPFGIIPCPSGSACEISDNLGSAKCDGIFNPNDSGPGGAKEGENCMYLNQCADGMMCLGPQGQQATCRMLCLTPNSSPPFDAGSLAMGPGTGGCNAGKTCSGGLNAQQFPSWISLCQ